MRFPSPKRATTREMLSAAVALLGVSALGIYEPWRFGVMLIPLVFAWLGFRITFQRQRDDVLRILDDGLEIAGAGSTNFTAWSHVESVVAGPGSFTTLRFVGGGMLQVPNRELIDAIPEFVRRETVTSTEDPASKKTNTKKTVLLWLVLIVLFYGVFRLLENAP
jgi:hypothetical protein